MDAPEDCPTQVAVDVNFERFRGLVIDALRTVADQVRKQRCPAAEERTWLWVVWCDESCRPQPQAWCVTRLVAHPQDVRTRTFTLTKQELKLGV